MGVRGRRSIRESFLEEGVLFFSQRTGEGWTE